MSNRHNLPGWKGKVRWAPTGFHLKKFFTCNFPQIDLPFRNFHLLLVSSRWEIWIKTWGDLVDVCDHRILNSWRIGMKGRLSINCVGKFVSHGNDWEGNGKWLWSFWWAKGNEWIWNGHIILLSVTRARRRGRKRWSNGNHWSFTTSALDCEFHRSSIFSRDSE
jgi:hypothetical protein